MNPTAVQLARAAEAPRRPWPRLALCLTGLCAFICAQSTVAEDARPAPPTLLVTGNVETPLTLGVADLQRLTVQRIEDTRQTGMAGTSSKEIGETRRYSGVLLRDVLAAAKPIEKEHHDLRRNVVVATATDGYVAVFSWAELFLSPVGDGALVIFERDGAPLPPSEGPFALLSLRDTQAGPRHVKWLKTIEIRRIGN